MMNKKEDGYLESGEILQLKLNSDLVVLSSCRSGLGEIDEAEGVIGMQKAFFEAGAKSVVVSLWDVNDKYTSLFMQSFYKYLVMVLINQKHLEKQKYFSNKIILLIHIIGQPLFFPVMFLKFKTSKQHHQTIFYLFCLGFLFQYLRSILHAEKPR